MVDVEMQAMTHSSYQRKHHNGSDVKHKQKNLLQQRIPRRGLAGIALKMVARPHCCDWLSLEARMPLGEYPQETSRESKLSTRKPEAT
jgi:hypothetical protein